MMKTTVSRMLLIAAAAGALAACNQKPAENTMAANDMMANDGMMAGNDAMAGDGSVMVGGSPMLPTKNVVENASTASNLTTLVAAVKAAGLVQTLSGPGPFTVFAPDNAAFEKLPAGTVDTLVKPESKETLTGILTYHVVPGTMTAAALSSAIDAGNGKAELKTVAGGTLTAMKDGTSIVLTDAKGGKSTVSQADVTQSNGVAHVIDTVLMPN